MDCSDDSWRDIFSGKHERGALWLLMCGALEKKHLLTYLLTYTKAEEHHSIAADQGIDRQLWRSMVADVVVDNKAP